MAAKIVYYGPGLCGKTTNLHHIYGRTAPGSRGEMVSLETETDRTLFFDLLPLDVGVIGGFKTRVQLYTVPGQVFYNTTRKLVLKGVDGIVFVADSQKAMKDANVESMANLRTNLAEIGIKLDELPLVFQYNKRDLPNILSLEELEESLNPDRRHESYEACAVLGQGVFETLKAISKITLRSVKKKMLGDERTARPAPLAGSSGFLDLAGGPPKESGERAAGDARGVGRAFLAPQWPRPSAAPANRARRRIATPRPGPERAPAESAEIGDVSFAQTPGWRSSTSGFVRTSTSCRSSTSCGATRPRTPPPDRAVRRAAAEVSIDDLLANSLNHRKEINRVFDVQVPQADLARGPRGAGRHGDRGREKPRDRREENVLHPARHEIRYSKGASLAEVSHLVQVGHIPAKPSSAADNGPRQKPFAIFWNPGLPFPYLLMKSVPGNRGILVAMAAAVALAAGCSASAKRVQPQAEAVRARSAGRRRRPRGVPEGPRGRAGGRLPVRRGVLRPGPRVMSGRRTASLRRIPRRSPSPTSSTPGSSARRPSFRTAEAELQEAQDAQKVPALLPTETDATPADVAKAREAVDTDSPTNRYDIPIVVNDSVLRILAVYQNQLHDIIGRGLARSGRFTPMIERIFAEEGLPKDLAQVAMVESSFIPRARSPKAALRDLAVHPLDGRRLRPDSELASSTRETTPRSPPARGRAVPAVPPRALPRLVPGDGRVQRRRRQDPPRHGEDRVHGLLADSRRRA